VQEVGRQHALEARHRGQVEPHHDAALPLVHRLEDEIGAIGLHEWAHLGEGAVQIRSIDHRPPSDDEVLSAAIVYDPSLPGAATPARPRPPRGGLRSSWPMADTTPAGRSGGARLRSRRIHPAAHVALWSLLAACSGGGHTTPRPTTSVPAPGPPTTTTAATGPAPSSTVSGASTAGAGGGDIVVEGIATQKNHPDTDVGFAARINRFNRAGGLNGRLVRFLGVKDDGLDPAQNLSLLQSIVDTDGALVVAPVATEALLGPSAAFLAKRQVTAIGLGTSAAFCAEAAATTAPGISPDGCLANPSYAAAADLAHIVTASGVPAAQVRLAVVGQDLDADKNVVTALTGLAKAQGVQVVYQSNAIASQGVTDYSPIVRALLASAPNVVDEVTDFGGSVALAAVLQATGYRGAVINRVAYAPASVLGQADIAATLSGVYVDAPYPVDENVTNPAVAQIRTDLTAISKPPTVDLAIAIGYWSADLLIQLLQAAAARGGPLTAAGVSAVAPGGWTYHGTPGGPPDLAFPAPGWVAPDGCSTLLQLSGTTYKEIAPYGCGPVTKIG